MNDYTFWMVIADGSQTSARRHTTEKAAREEAQRVAAKEHKSVWLLQAVARVDLPEPATKWTNRLFPEPQPETNT